MSSNSVVVSGSSNRALAYRIAAALGAENGQVEIRKFPDNEKYVRIASDVKGRSVVLVQSMAFNPDEYLVESILMTAALKGAGAKAVIAAIPYLAYARQDEKFKEGEVVSIELVAKMLRSSGVDGLITVDAHRHRIIDFSSIFGGPSIDVSVMPQLGRYAIQAGFADSNTVVIGPDGEAEPWAASAAQSMNVKDYAALKKKRFGDEEVKVVTTRDIPLKGRRVLIVDDIISTGATIVEASKLLKESGAGQISVGCAHGIYVSDALYKIYKEGITNVFSSDSVPNQTTRVSVAQPIADGVKAILKEL
ncbi:MAG: ribose-phosphate diphosphokinase [Nitrososphaerota archaeon]|nr:ribose-phosphate diphosphokinase [Nitrososphaerota archaeon]MDG7048614.1 ribose-phosphate diphosphokinase [Nitrososphaerota archaeon]MDG7051447.1 ribose-phosphate diphosphokinase [Nitrososphaerota archaeon]